MRVVPARRARRVLVGALGLALAGLSVCGDGAGPATPGPGSRAPTPSPSPEPPAPSIEFRIANPLEPRSGVPVQLLEGGGFYAEVQIPGLVYTSDLQDLFGTTADFTLRIVTDAPPDQLVVPDSVVPQFPEIRVLGLARFPVEAPADAVDGEPDATWEIRLAPPAGGLPAGMAVADDVLRVVVADVPRAECGALSLRGSLRGGSSLATRALVTLDSPHLYAGLSLVAPYQPKVFDSPHHPIIFPEEFPFEESAGGFRTTIPIRWTGQFHGPLRLTAQLPGCTPLPLTCGETGCSNR